MASTKARLLKQDFPVHGIKGWQRAPFEHTLCSLFKNLSMPLFLMGCFPVNFQEAKRPLRTKSVKRPTKVGKRPINEGKRPMKAKVLVCVSVGCLMDCFRPPPLRRKTAPLKRPIRRSMICDISALLDPSRGSWLPTLIHLVWKQKRGGGKEGMEGRREVATAKNLAENKVHVWKVHVCLPW